MWDQGLCWRWTWRCSSAYLPEAWGVLFQIHSYPPSWIWSVRPVGLKSHFLSFFKFYFIFYIIFVLFFPLPISPLIPLSPPEVTTLLSMSLRPLSFLFNPPSPHPQLSPRSPSVNLSTECFQLPAPWRPPSQQGTAFLTGNLAHILNLSNFSSDTM